MSGGIKVFARLAEKYVKTEKGALLSVWAVNSGALIPLVMGAILAGGSVGDSVSFLGETPILTASITELPLLDHIQG